MHHTPERRVAWATLLLALLAPPAWGQTYPSRPITLVVPYPAGAAVDRVGRALGVELGKRLGTTVVVENLGGASGTLGAKKVMRERADGHTLLMGTVNDMVVAPAALKAGYSVADFTAIGKVSVNSTVLVAHPGLKAASVDELVQLARAAKDPLLSGAAGAAMMQTIGGTLLADKGGFRISHVIYKGGAPLLNDLVGGQVQVGTVALTSALPMIRDGRLKALGVISAHRDPTAPEIPTVNEGRFVQAVEADLWTGLFAPAGLPADVLARLSRAVNETLADPGYRSAEFKAGSVAVEAGDPASFKTFVQREETRLRPVLATLKVD